MNKLIASLLALGLLAGAANAASPQSVFADIANTAPKSLFDQIRDTAPRTIFDDLRDTAPHDGKVFQDLTLTAP